MFCGSNTKVADKNREEKKKPTAPTCAAIPNSEGTRAIDNRVISNANTTHHNRLKSVFFHKL